MKALWYIPAIILGLLSLVFFIGIFNTKILMNKNKPNQKPPTQKQAVIMWLVLGFLGFICLGLSGSFNDNKPQQAASADKTVVSPSPEADLSAVAKSDEAAAKDADPTEMATKSATKHFDSAQTKLDKANGFLEITAAGSDNLTNNMVKDGMWIDATDTLKDLKDVVAIKDVAFSITLPMVDKFGNESQSVVMKINLTQATLKKINWNNFTFSNLPDIADSYWEHPALSK